MNMERSDTLPSSPKEDKKPSTLKEEPILRKVDNVGRISISPKLFDRLGVSDKSSLLLYIENNNQIVIKKDEEVCVYCGNPETIVHETGIEICADCRNHQENVFNLVENRYEKQTFFTGKRLVIPFKIRKKLDIKTGDTIKVLPKKDRLVLEKAE